MKLHRGICTWVGTGAQKLTYIVILMSQRVRHVVSTCCRLGFHAACSCWAPSPTASTAAALPTDATQAAAPTPATIPAATAALHTAIEHDSKLREADAVLAVPLATLRWAAQDHCGVGGSDSAGDRIGDT